MPMTIFKHRNNGERWHLTVRWPADLPGDAEQRDEWLAWMRDNCPDCMCVFRFNNGTDPHWEVRGGDQAQLMLMLMRWR